MKIQRTARKRSFLALSLSYSNYPSLPKPNLTSDERPVRSLTSGITDSHGVTGGVYKTRERIHRDILIRDY